MGFYGGLVNRSHRNAVSSPESSLTASVLDSLELTESPHAKDELLLPDSPALDTPVEDESGWLNTTTLLASCSPPVLTVPWWTSADGTVPVPAAKDRAVGALSSATTGERSPGDARATAAEGCRNEFDTTSVFSGVETSVTLHDVCNKTISGGGSTTNGGCSSQFSSGARSQVASGSRSGGGTAAAAISPDAAVSTIGRQPQQQQPILPRIPCDYRSISVSSTSNSNRGGQHQQQASAIGVGGRPFAASFHPTTADHDEDEGEDDDDDGPSDLLTPALPDIDWTNETCLDTTGTGDFPGYVVEDASHVWLNSSNSNSGSSTSGSLDEYATVDQQQTTPFIETSVHCGADLLDELVAADQPVSLHEEIEQLSSAFDCDPSNHHLVSVASPMLPYGLLADDTEPVSFNILKWLQEDTSANVASIPAQQIVTSNTIPVPSGARQQHHLEQQPAGVTFEHTLDQIHNFVGLTRPDVGKVAHRRTGASTASISNTNATTTTIATTTNNAPTSALNLQRDHSYFTLKRRLQAEDVSATSVGGSLPKVPRTLLPLDQAMQQQPQQYSHFSTPPSVGGSKPQLKHTPAGKMSIATRKGPALVLNIGKATAKQSVATAAVTATNTCGPAASTTTTTTAVTNEPLLRQLWQAATLNTPDLTNDILDLEDEKFDLLSFIDTSNDLLDLTSDPTVNANNPTDEVKPTPNLSLPPPDIPEVAGNDDGTGPARPHSQFLTLDALRQLTCSSPSPTFSGNRSTGREERSGGRRSNSGSIHHLTSTYSIGSRSSASSVCGDSSSDVSSNVKAPKRRGRPPKAAGTVRDRSQYEHLSEADWRYREQRDKNNEASRKSRINRKDREQRLEMEAMRLTAQYDRLSQEERRLQRECKRWRKAVMKLALL